VTTGDQLRALIDRESDRSGVVDAGDLIVIVAGSTDGVPGSTDLVLIHQVGGTR
jgi:pyruvate kinase